MDLWFEVVMALLSGLSVALLALGLFILRDLRDRVSRLETRAMNESLPIRGLRPASA